MLLASVLHALRYPGVQAALAAALVGALTAGTGGALRGLVGTVVLVLAADLLVLLVGTCLGFVASQVEVGTGRVLRQYRWGRHDVVVRRLPWTVGTSGLHRGRRLLRTRVATAVLVRLAALAAVAVLLLGRAPWQGLAAGAACLLALSFAGGRDGRGRPADGRLLLRLPRSSEAHLRGWWRSPLGGAALDAAWRLDHATAAALARQALAVDPQDASARTALSCAADETGDVETALEMAEWAAAAQPQGPERIVASSNLAWALLRCAEAGRPAPDWSARAGAALDEAERLGGSTWQLEDNRALWHLLHGRLHSAESHLGWPLEEAVHPQERADVLLTYAAVLHERGDRSTAAQVLAESRRLWASPRLPDVERRMGVVAG